MPYSDLCACIKLSQIFLRGLVFLPAYCVLLNTITKFIPISSSYLKKKSIVLLVDR